MIFQVNDGWQFVDGFSKEYLKDPSLIQGTRVRIPHTFKLLYFNYFDEKSYQKIGTYYKKLLINKSYKGKYIALHFDAVMTRATIYINGKLLQVHDGGYLPFDADISNCVNFGEENDVIVVVDSREIPEIPPFGHVIDYLTYSGIYREVTLRIYNKEHVNHLRISPVSLTKLVLYIDSTIERKSHFDVVLLDSESKAVKSWQLEPSESQTYELGGFKAEYWDLEHPRLYKLKIDIVSDKTVHTITERFGFRFVRISDDGFYLNEKKIKLVGLNLHQAYPYMGYAATKSLQELDVDILKNQLGTNVVRTSHYPNSKHFLNRCDEIGLLVFTEIPGWQFVSKNPEWRKNCLRNVTDMIVEDFNHPSIFIWGVRINESPDDDELYSETNRIAHQLDSTRPTGGVRNFRESNLLEDVYTYNDFLHNGNNKGLLKALKGPYMVTEHNGHMHPTKISDPEASRVDQALRHLSVIDDFMGDDGICALTGWCMTDYNTHQEFGAGDRICYHGVMDMFRNKKYAAYAYESQSDDHVVLFPMYYFEPGDYDEMNVPYFYILTNCEAVELYIGKKLVQTYYPDTEDYPNLKHPPIKINGFLSDLSEYKTRFGVKETEKLVDYFKQVHELGGIVGMSLKTKLGMLSFMRRHKLSTAELTAIYTKHNNLWLSSDMTFTMVGLVSGQPVIKKTIVRKTFDHINIDVSNGQLEEGETYDMAQVKLVCVDKEDNELPYLTKGFKLTSNGLIEIVGPKYIVTRGGIASFYVRTTGSVGTANILVESDEVRKTISFDVRKKEVLKI